MRPYTTLIYNSCYYNLLYIILKPVHVNKSSLSTTRSFHNSSFGQPLYLGLNRSFGEVTPLTKSFLLN